MLLRKLNCLAIVGLLLLVLLVGAPAPPATTPQQSKSQAETDKSAAEKEKSAAQQPASDKAIVWKTVTAWNKGYPYNDPLEKLQQRVNSNPKLTGKLKIEIAGGPEVIGAFNQLEALQKGVVQAIMGAPGYFAGALPIDNFFELSPYNPAEEREKGVWDYMNQVNSKVGVFFLYTVNTQPTGQTMAMFVQKPVSSLADLKGLKIRTSPTYLALIQGVGATPVQMPSSEIYTALQQGVIDGYCNPVATISPLGLKDVTKYAIDHPFYNTHVGLAVKREAWDQLSKEVQTELIEAAKSIETETGSWHQELDKKEREEMGKAGVKFVKFSESDAKKFREIAYDGFWAQAMKDAPTEAAKLRELYGLPVWNGR